MELTIYHGSKDIIEKPTFGKGKPYNDYGLGFYCTEDLELAKEWSVTEGIDGYANKYKINVDNLKILDLSKKGYTTLNWITILLQNRVFNLKNDIAKEGKKFLTTHFNLNTKDYDIIKGYRADDSYFAYAENFLNNTISVKKLSEALKLGGLGEQVVLMSNKAFDSLEYLGNEKVSCEIYYPLRKDRNEKARLEFLNNRRSPFSKDDIYLADIIRGGVKLDDPRLQ